MPRKKPAPRTVEQNIEFSARQLIGNLQRVPKVKIPTPAEVAQQQLQQAIANVRARQLRRSFWTPTEGIYYNRDTGRPYIPHHEAERNFVYSDRPTNCAVLGSEGCVAAETIINDVPIAERKEPSVVWTLDGIARSSSGYLKGQANLYRVRTELGHEVVVTKDHRFLSKLGFYPLSALRVGDAIASGDIDYARESFEKARDYLDDYSSSFHPCDELPILSDALHQDNVSLRVVPRACNDKGVCRCRDHACTEDSFYQSKVDSLIYESSLPSFSTCGKQCLAQLYSGQRLFATSLLQDIPFLPSSYPAQEHWCICDSKKIAPSFAKLHLRCFEKHSTSQTSLWRDSLSEINVPLRRNQSYGLARDFLFSYPHYILKWDKIASITFEKYGDYYDLSVPVGEHYFAQGLYHHNSGKSVSGIIKDCERIRRGMDGILVSNDLPHFRKSLWPEFKRWLPDGVVVEDQQYRLDFAWEPREPFTLAFKNGATVLCGGIEDASGFEGPNVSWYHYDEARRAKDASAIKVLKGRTRISGPDGEPPQGWITTTKPNTTDHWIYEYYGPIQYDEDGNIDDQYLSFKEDLLVVDLYVRDNLVNLADGFLDQRAQGLSPEEIAILIENEWGDVLDVEAFLPSIAMWDSLKETIPPLDRDTPVVMALDGAEKSDTFGVLVGSWHPTKGQAVSVIRHVMAWQPKGHLLNFDEIEQELRTFIATHNVILLTYDAALVRQVIRRLSDVVWTKEFSQGRDRLAADKQLLDAVIGRTIVHDGNLLLRKHIAGAAKKMYGDDGRKLRLVKMSSKSKIDLAVCASMLNDWLKNPKLALSGNKIIGGL